MKDLFSVFKTLFSWFTLLIHFSHWVISALLILGSIKSTSMGIVTRAVKSKDKSYKNQVNSNAGGSTDTKYP